MVSRYRGPLRAYRISDIRDPIFDGGAAAKYGGRWNSPGFRVIYAGTSYAGTMIEKLAQTGTGKMPRNQHWITIDIPQDVEIEEIQPSDVPNWQLPGLVASRTYGDRWLREQRTAVLVVPSVVALPHERNVVINQAHPDFNKLSASAPERVIWDHRLFQGGASGET